MRTKKIKKYVKRRTLKRVRHIGGSKIYISGEAFKNACKYNLDDRYPVIPIDSSLKENDRVFLKQEDIDNFISLNPSKKVHLVVHNTDETFEDSHMDKVRPYVNKVYAVNSFAKGAIQIPIGFRDDQYTPHSVLDNINSKKATKNILCLLNFSIGEKIADERNRALNAFNKYDWAVKDTNNSPALHRNHKNEETKKKREEFYEKLKQTKFVICPFGAGKDTHRVYEAMFFGAIPVIKTSFLDPIYKKLGGCWIVNDWSEVTKEECNRRWNEVKPFNIDVEKWLSMSGGSKSLKIAFYAGHLGERGTEVAMFDYAYYNKHILKNDSIIIYNTYLPNTTNNDKVIQKYKDNFEMFTLDTDVDKMGQIDKILTDQVCDMIYMIISGEKTDIPTKAKVLIHCVFDTIVPPFGDVYAKISPAVKGDYPVVPHMINLPSHSRNMRSKLSIPDDVTVFGRYGGKGTFNIKYVHGIVYDIAKNNPNIYFIFANTDKFCDNLPNIIHIDTIANLEEKVEFINTCDAMLWARLDGETFGLSIGEFSSKNKPVFATDIGYRAHVEILGNKGIWYKEDNLKDLLLNFKKEDYAGKDLNAYKDYEPEKVMKIFKDVFIKGTQKGGSSTLSFITYGNNNFAKAKERIINEAKGMGVFNGTIKAYGPEDLSKDFLEKTKLVIHEGRGGGYWLWKPYIIYDMLNKMNDNDILLYTDSGCTLQKQYVKRLNEYFNMIKPDSKYSVLAMRLKSGKHDDGLLSSKIWTTTAIFDYFKINLNSEIANNDSVLATIVICRKCPESLSVIRKWLDVAEERPELFSDIHNEESKKNQFFKENRHDQAVYNIIVQIPPYNKHVKIIEEEIEGNQPGPVKATRKHSGGNKTHKNIKNPLISVVIPTYNRFKYLLNTINSIKEQTYKNIEIIVVNDKSTEEEYYTHKFDGVKIIHLPKNTKEIYGYACSAHVRNEGIKVSNGKYIAFCDDDDIWLPNKLDLQINAIKSSGCKISCTEGLNGDGEYNKKTKYLKHNKEKHYEQIKDIYETKGSKLFENGYPKTWTKDFLKVHNCVLTSSVLIDKSILTHINNFKLLKNTESEDYDCWLRALDHSNIIYVDEPCVYYDNLHGYGRQYGGNKEENECKYVSTRGLLKSCDIHSKLVHNEDLNQYNNFKNIKDGDSVYVRSSKLKYFIDNFNIIKNKIVLVIGDGDYTFPDDFFNSDDFIKFIENDKIIHMFAMNSTKDHSKITRTPIGVNYQSLALDSEKNYTPEWGPRMSPEDQEKEIEEIRKKSLPFDKRKIKCYSNFHFNMQDDRKYTKDRRDAKEQIPSECIEYEQTYIPRKDTHLKQIDYAFVVCPHGNGLDCNRQWEALILGCIPIVKTSSIDSLYEELPVLIVKEWSDITLDLLNKIITKYKDKKFNYDKLTLKYWIDKINLYK